MKAVILTYSYWENPSHLYYSCQLELLSAPATLRYPAKYQILRAEVSFIFKSCNWHTKLNQGLPSWNTLLLSTSSMQKNPFCFVMDSIAGHLDFREKSWFQASVVQLVEQKSHTIIANGFIVVPSITLIHQKFV